ncbi:tRNA-dihydrouridine synthase [Entamoeba marina]
MKQNSNDVSVVSSETKFNFYKNKLGNPNVILAPMVDGSDISYRRLVRKYGVDLCYTPMINSKVFVADKTFRQEVLKTIDQQEKPIVIQIVGNDVDDMRRTAKFLQKYADVIDINLGCPQKIAKKGKYGAYLAMDFELTKSIVTEVVNAVDIPVFCKIRVFDDEQKNFGFARWEIIGKIKQRVDIPVIANGGITDLESLEKCKEITKADGFMIGMGLLMNPALCKKQLNDNYSIAFEYLQEALEMKKTFTVELSHIKGHLIKMLLHYIRSDKEFLKEIGNAHTEEQITSWLARVEDKYYRKRDSSETPVPNQKRVVETIDSPKES